MRLTSVAIRNHTRVADMHIEVRRHLVLVGTNDSGKTSILRCLDLLLGATQGALYTSITADDVRDRARPFVVEAQLECGAKAYRNQSYCFRLLVQVLKTGMCRSVHSIEVPGSGASPSKVPSVSAWAGGVVPPGMAKR